MKNSLTSIVLFKTSKMSHSLYVKYIHFDVILYDISQKSNIYNTVNIVTCIVGGRTCEFGRLELMRSSPLQLPHPLKLLLAQPPKVAISFA